MNMIEVTKLLGKALREKLCFVELSPAGRGAYDFEYDPTYELAVDGYRITLSDEWCGESQNSGFCYRRFLGVDGEFSCRVAQLNGVARKLLDKIPIGQDEDIAKAAGVQDLI